MSKLINIGGDLYIPADTIVKVNGPYTHRDNEWYCVIGYKYLDEYKTNVFYFNNTFVTTEDHADAHTKRLIDRINESR